MSRWVPVLLAGLVLGLPTLARAEDPPASAARPQGEPRVLRLGELVIPGRIHNPGVVFVLERNRPRFTPRPLERSFLSEVVRSTRGL